MSASRQFAGAVATGIARAGIDALTELAGRKIPRTQAGLLREQAQVQEWVGRAEALLGSAQAYRAAVSTDIWETVTAGRPATLEQQARCRLAASHAVENAVQAMDLMWRAGGTTSIEQRHVLARGWRDVHVVGQHAAVHQSTFPSVDAPSWGSIRGPNWHDGTGAHRDLSRPNFPLDRESAEPLAGLRRRAIRAHQRESAGTTISATISARG